MNTSRFSEVKFTHAFQPIVDIRKQETISYEILLRGINNEPPPVVFGSVKQEDLMDFDQFSRERALGTARRLGVNCLLNLNFTPRAILYDQGHYIRATRERAVELGLKPEQLVMEITEGELIHEPVLFSKLLNQIRRERITIAIDDFGAGYAGLNMLAEVLPDLIKLDMALLKGIDRNGPRQSIVMAICDVCQDLGIDVLAEGVETEAELSFLKKCGITIYQGYLFAKPGVEYLPEPVFH